MALKLKLVTFSTPASTGNLSITDVGFEPQLVRFFGLGTTDTKVVDLNISMGAMDSYGSQFALGTCEDNGLGTGVSGRMFSASKCINTLLPSDRTLDVAATYVSMDSDGFTINFSNIPASTQTCHALCVAGITDIRVGTELTKTSTGTRSKTIATGHQPDAIEIFSIGTSLLDTIRADVRYSQGISAGGAGSAIAFTSNHNQGTSDTNRLYRTGSIFQINADNAQATLDKSKIQTFDANGFTMYQAVSNGTNLYFGFISYQGVKAAVPTMNSPTSASEVSVTGVGFKPELLIQSSIIASSAGTFYNNCCLMSGVAVSPTEQMTTWGWIDNGESTSIAYQGQNDDNFIEFSPVGSASTIVGSLESMDTDGFTVDWTTSTAATVYLFLALSTIDQLDSEDITTGSPVIDTSTISQTHVFETEEISAEVTYIDNSTIEQIHVFETEEINSGNPVLGTPVLFQINILISEDITTSAPIIGISELNQTHVIGSEDITTDSPVLDQSTLNQNHELISNNITSGEPAIDSSDLTQKHNLSSNDLTANVPVLDVGFLTQVHILSSENLTAGIPTIDSPILVHIVVFPADDLISGTPTLGTPVIAQKHVLTAFNLDTAEPVVPDGSLSQLHILSSGDIDTAAPVFMTPVLTWRILTVLPARIHFVIKEDRTFMVGNEIRTFPVIKEDREHMVPIEDRLTTIQQENRIVIITLDNRTFFVQEENRKFIHPPTNK